MVTEKKIEVGDVVKLISHATKYMTAHSLDGNYVECVWTNQDGEMIFRIFGIDELELVSKHAAVSEATKL